jgi:multiple sugar transport system permease protein
VIGCYVAVAVFLVWVLVPIVQMVLTSFKSTYAIFQPTIHLNFAPTMANYETVFGKLDFLRNVLNSCLIAGVSTAIALTLGVPAGYALCRLNIRFEEAWAQGILLARMVPAVTLMVPMYVLMSKASLLGSYWGVILAHTSFELPLVIWMMRSFFLDVPPALEEAAMIDGASRFRVFWQIAVPLTGPGISVTAILSILLSWNEFLFALVLGGRGTQTAPIAVSKFVGINIDWGGSMAAATIALVPIFVMGLAVQKFLVRGLTMGAVKE